MPTARGRIRCWLPARWRLEAAAANASRSALRRGRLSGENVDYRLAPEPRFAPFEDCVFAVRWAAENAARYGGDARRLAIGSDSGNAAAVAAYPWKIRARPESERHCSSRRLRRGAPKQPDPAMGGPAIAKSSPTR
jgi:hypothetical protein